MKIVIFPCDRYEMRRIRTEGKECGTDRSDISFIILGRYIVEKRLFHEMRTFFYGDSEVLVEEHDEGYCAQQWNRGDVGMHKGFCIEMVQIVLGKLLRAQVGLRR